MIHSVIRIARLIPGMSAVVLIAGCCSQFGGYEVELLVPGYGFNGIHGIAFDDQDRLYVGSVIGQSIYRVDTETGEAETFIQMLLREREGFAGELPPIMEPVRAEDAPGAVCYRVTPELYCGYQRGLVGNVGDLKPDSPTRYRDPGHHVQGTLYLDGAWLLAAESVARPVGGGGPSRLILDYMAVDVNLIMHPPTSGETGLLRVLLDGEPVSGEAAGADVVDGVVKVDRPQMYRLVRGVDAAAHELVLEIQAYLDVLAREDEQKNQQAERKGSRGTPGRGTMRSRSQPSARARPRRGSIRKRRGR